MRKTLLSVLAAAVLLGAANFGLAQSQMKPLVIVSFAGYDKLKADIGVIGRLGGNPNFADGLEMMLKMMTQGKGLTGLDTKRPWGIVCSAGGRDWEQRYSIVDQIGPIYGFVPVTDLKQLMEAAKSSPKLAAASGTSSSATFMKSKPAERPSGSHKRAIGPSSLSIHRIWPTRRPIR